MAQKYVPKPISFVPPVLKRKFIAPGTPREMGALVMIIGFAILMASAWPAATDILASSGARSAQSQYVGQAPFRSGNAGRMVGVYVFKDEAKIDTGVRGHRVYTNEAVIPKSVRVVWPKGRPQRAQVVGEYKDYLLGVPIGLAIFGFGLWLRRKRVDAFALAMNPTEPPNSPPDQPATPL